MNRAFWFWFIPVALVSFFTSDAYTRNSKKSLATITGTVLKTKS